MGKEIKGHWPDKTHQDEHRDLFNSLITLMGDMNDAFKNVEGVDYLPRIDGINLDWNEIPVGLLLNWAMMNARKVSHKHEDTTIKKKTTKNIIRPGRDPGNGRCDSTSSIRTDKREED